MQNKISKQLLKKYTNNRCTTEEITLVESWYVALGREKNNEPITMKHLEDTKKLLDAALAAIINTNTKK